MEEKQKDFGFIKKLLNNSPLLKWVKKFSADGLQEKDNSENFEIEMNEDSLAISDVGMVKMFYSASRFKGETYISLDIKHIKEVLSLIEGEGRLIINKADENRFCYIQSEGNVVVIAPTSEAEDKPKKKNKKVDKSKSEDKEQKQ